MAGENVQAKFTLDARSVFSTLTKMIASIKETEKAVTSLNAMLGQTSMAMTTVERASMTMSAAMKGVSTELTSANSRLTNMSTRALKARDSMSELSTAGLKNTFIMDDVAKQAETVQVSMQAMATATNEANAAMGRMRGGRFPRGGGGAAGAAEHEAEERTFMGALNKTRVFGGFSFDHLLNTGLNVLIGTELAKEGLRPAMEMEQRRNAFNAMFMGNDVERKTMEDAVNKTVKEIPTATFSDTMQTFRELRGMMTHKELAAQELSQFMKFKAVLATTTGELPDMHGHTDEAAQTLMKAAEMSARSNNPDEINHFMDLFLQGNIASGGLSKINAFAQTIKSMRSARFGKTDDFWLGLSHFVAEGSMGKGTGMTGSMLSGFDAIFRGGTVNKKAAAALMELGVLPPNAMIPTTTTGTTMDISKMKGFKLAGRDPFQFIWQILEPALAKSAGLTVEQFGKLAEDVKKDIIEKHLGTLPKNVKDLIEQSIISEQQIKRQIALSKQVKGVNDQFNNAMNTSAMRMQLVTTQFHVLLEQLGTPVLKAMNPVLDELFKALKRANDNMPAFIAGLNAMQSNWKEFIKLNPQIAQAGKTIVDVTGKVVNSFGILGDMMSAKNEQMQRLLGVTATGGAAALTGAAIGSLIAPGVGTAIGAAVGGAIGTADALHATAEAGDLSPGMAEQHRKFVEAHKEFKEPSNMPSAGIIAPKPSGSSHPLAAAAQQAQHAADLHRQQAQAMDNLSSYLHRANKTMPTKRDLVSGQIMSGATNTRSGGSPSQTTLLQRGAQ